MVFSLIVFFIIIVGIHVLILIRKKLYKDLIFSILLFSIGMIYSFGLIYQWELPNPTKRLEILSESGWIMLKNYLINNNL
ncbi:hypothetical protein SAMN03080606_02448 [Alkaliphilus peptidifermentans DSM 18978]|uniref:Uncharacterized protein n=1 Tax=Alkaliphilus peptidifermentans DSM 18978 TaxID=1120976 RepID=A0A1G5ILL1_9FIRM|nr:hypothetical protein SAMN03080606_02448 [Alkaliphilus peptidifermentans DSM 18978]